MPYMLILKGVFKMDFLKLMNEVILSQNFTVGCKKTQKYCNKLFLYNQLQVDFSLSGKQCMTSDLSIALFIDFLNTCLTLGIYSKLGRSFVLEFSPANYIQCRNSMRRCFSILFIPRLCCVSHNSSHDGMLTTPFCLSIFSLSPGRFQKRKNFFLSSKNETLVSKQ